MASVRERLTALLGAVDLSWAVKPADRALRRFSTRTRLVVVMVLLALPSIVLTGAQVRAASAGRDAVALGILLLACWVAAAVVWRVRRDLGLLVGSVFAIAMNDLGSRELPTGPDEFGQMGQALEMTREQLIENLIQLTGTQAEREQQLQANFTQQRTAEKQSRERAQAAIDETATTIVGELGDVVEQMSAVNRVTAVIEGKVATADAATRSVVTETHEADRLLHALSQSLSQVAAVAQLISGIADQTRLLALNATIEAARAGDAGRGFSVVAHEVKNLATSTARSTEEITSTIGSLRRDAGAVADAISRMSGGIGGLDEANAVLTEVAREQQTLVAQLTRSLADTIDRVRNMSALTTKLERRRYERVPTAGRVVYVHRGQEWEAELLDLSAGGLRCAVPPAEGPAEDETVEVCVPLMDGPAQFACRVARRALTADAVQLGLEFTEVDAATAAALAAHLAT